MNSEETHTVTERRKSLTQDQTKNRRAVMLQWCSLHYHIIQQHFQFSSENWAVVRASFSHYQGFFVFPMCKHICEPLTFLSLNPVFHRDHYFKIDRPLLPSLAYYYLKVPKWKMFSVTTLYLAKRSIKSQCIQLMKIFF